MLSQKGKIPRLLTSLEIKKKTKSVCVCLFSTIFFGSGFQPPPKKLKIIIWYKKFVRIQELRLVLIKTTSFLRKKFSFTSTFHFKNVRKMTIEFRPISTKTTSLWRNNLEAKMQNKPSKTISANCQKISDVKKWCKIRTRISSYFKKNNFTLTE